MANIDYGKILKRSIELTRRSKWLWVYGLALAAFGSAGSGGSGGGGSSSTPDIPKDVPQDLPEKTTYVLGQATSLIKDWLTSVPLSLWILVGTGIFLLILIWIGISWVIQSWAKGALIAGIEDADHDQKVTLLSTSPKGIAKIKHLILLGLVSFGILVMIALVGTLGGLLLFLLQNLVGTVGMILLFIWILVLAATFFIMLIYASILGIYAERLIVLKNHTPWQAWKKGLKMARRHFIPTFVMGMINGAVGCSVGCLSTFVLLIVLGIPAFILVLPYVKDGFQMPPWPLFGGLGILILLFIYLNYAITAILTVFRYSNWNLLFKELMREEEAHD